MRPTCDRLWEIDALREGRLGPKDAEAFERHRRTCSACAAVLARDEHLQTIAKALPEPPLNELEERRLRGRILHDVATRAPEPSRPLRIAAVLAVAVAVAFFGRKAAVSPHAPPAPPALVAQSPDSAPAAAPPVSFAGSVLSAEGARWRQARDGGTERLILEDGTVNIHVRHQSPGERFFVALPDGELEVRGTTFRVTVQNAATQAIDVEEGLVALRLTGTAELELSAGARWRRPAPRVAPATAPHAPRERPAAPRIDGGAERDLEAGTEAYAAAIALMQQGAYSPAADAFRAFGRVYPRAPQAEDASFLEAATLARAGRPDAAARAAEDHLARFPHSFHRKDAAILVARAARDRGDCEQARAVLAPWLSPGDAEAIATLRKCAASAHSPMNGDDASGQ
ncbi:MAG TPA: FecR domain-containing protein [Polyangiaceae bacterium]|jgi:hypothetical protein